MRSFRAIKNLCYKLPIFWYELIVILKQWLYIIIISERLISINEWFLVRIKFNCLIVLRNFRALTAVVGFTCLLSLVSNLSLLLGLLSCSCTSKIQRILKVGSPPQTVLVNREGSNYVLASLLFIRGLWPIELYWSGVIEGSPKSNSGVWGIPIHSSLTGTGLMSAPPPL